MQKGFFGQNREKFAKNTEGKCGTNARIAIAINDFAQFGRHYKTGKKQGRKQAEETGITRFPLAGKGRKENSGAAAPGFSSASLLVSSAKATGHPEAGAASLATAQLMRVALRRIAGPACGAGGRRLPGVFRIRGLEARPLPRHWKADLAPASNSGVCGTTLSGEPDRLPFCRTAVRGPMRCGWQVGTWKRVWV